METLNADIVAAQLALPVATLEKIIGLLSSFTKVEKAVIFGSRAKGIARPFSDIDLSLFGEGLRWNDLNRIALALDDLDLVYKTDVNAFHLIQNTALQENILQRGILIYEKG